MLFLFLFLFFCEDEAFLSWLGGLDELHIGGQSGQVSLSSNPSDSLIL